MDLRYLRVHDLKAFTQNVQLALVAEGHITPIQTPGPCVVPYLLLSCCCRELFSLIKICQIWEVILQLFHWYPEEPHGMRADSLVCAQCWFCCTHWCSRKKLFCNGVTSCSGVCSITANVKCKLIMLNGITCPVKISYYNISLNMHCCLGYF